MHIITLKDQAPEDPRESAAVEIRCRYCGATHNSRGRPFNVAALNQHYRKMHPQHFEEERPEGALSCDICGKWKSRNGPPFVTEADLSRHRVFCAAKQRNKDSPMQPGDGEGAKLMTHAPSPSRRSASRPASSGESMLVSFCPQCGCNLRVVQAAISFVGNQ
jgi:hypothetical protein